MVDVNLENVPSKWEPSNANGKTREAEISAYIEGIGAAFEKARVARVSHERDWLLSEQIRFGRLDKGALTIKKRIEAAGLYWYALSDAPEADGRYFLNPGEQDKYNYGRFTLEDLEAWIDGKGPIVKSNKS